MMIIKLSLREKIYFFSLKTSKITKGFNIFFKIKN